MNNDISPEGELRREIYARFGLAMYYGQMLEFSIVNQLLAFSTYNTREETEAAVTRLLGESLGYLNRQLIHSGMDLTHLDDDLERARRLRNFLAHNYFRERALAVQLPAGRERMLDELAQAASFLQEIGERLYALTVEIYEARGVTDIDTDEAIKEGIKAAERLLPGRPLPGLSDERKAIVVTKDGYLVGDGSVTRTELARAQGQYVYPTFVLDVEWEKATDDERARLLSLAERLDTEEQPPI